MSPYADSILRSLRRIIRAIDLFSRDLEARCQLTAPQLVCLRQIQALGQVSPSALSRQIFLSPATVTGILNRLEAKNLIIRERKDSDRRLVTISLTPEGTKLTASAPLPLQDRFSSRLAALPGGDQAHIDQVLSHLVEMMEAGEIEADPIITLQRLPDDPS